MDAETIARTLNANRIARYRLAGENTREALERYLANARMISALYLPLNIFEVTVRNGLANHLRHRFGDGWFRNTDFTSRLHGHFARELAKAEAELEAESQEVAPDRIVSLLSMGFWAHITTKRARAEYFAKGWKANFPHGYASNRTLEDLHLVIESARLLRNRAFHHQAVFDKNLDDTVAAMIEAVGWRCAETEAFLRAAIQ
ncbi:MAG: hypothetical protein RKE49_06055 [Oceanicaulis sp.]